MWTLYTSSGDVVLLSAILNGVAMIANNTALVWGFALFASALLTTRASAAATIEGHRGAAGPVLTRGAYHMVAPIVLAMLFTSSDMKVTLTVENTTTGVTTQVGNVPIIIAAIPVGGSTLANAIAPVIVTAMSGANPSYGDITVAGHGFIDPMRRLLAARGSIEHLGSADSELRLVVGRCVTKEGGIDFTALNNQVMNAGNSGATATNSIAINGANPTGVGALLYQAAQNTSGLVPELASSSSTILNCADAAALVASDLTNELQSAEFARVVQGAVNGLDQPLPSADYSVTQLGTEYTAMRNWKSVSAAIAVGQQQANSELINFLFDEEVSSGLNCAQAAGSDKTVCEALMIQATELERNNLQAAANEVPMLEYSGAFGNYILALIIGLGPVIVMFMMLFGVDSGKCIKTAMHILVWPLLVTNVGAELVNAMLTMQFANFMNSVSQGGFLSPGTIHNAYKELSLQVGVGSHIMASLPVLMSMIFALGEAAGLASVAAEVTPKGNETGKAEAPSPVENAPLMRATSQSTLTQGDGWHSIQDAGALNAASADAGFKSLTRSSSNNVTDAEDQDKRESQELAKANRVADDLFHRNYSSLGLNTSEGDSIRSEMMNSFRESGTDALQISNSNEQGNQRGAEVAVTGGATSGLGGAAESGSSSGAAAPGGGGAAGLVRRAGGAAKTLLNAGVNAGFSGRATSSANERESLAEAFTRSTDLNRAKALSKALHSDVGEQILQSGGRENSKALSEGRSAADSYVESITHRKSHTSAIGQALQQSDSYVAAHQAIRGSEIAQQAQSNGEYRQYQFMQGAKFESLSGADKHMALAAEDMNSRSAEDFGGDERSRSAVQRHMAAVSMARDESLPEASRFAALKYLVGEGNAMIHGNFEAPKAGAFDAHAKPIPMPNDKTGVNAGFLRSEVSRATKGNEHLREPQAELDPKAVAGLRSLHGAAKAAADGGVHGITPPDGSRISDSVDYHLKQADEVAHLAAGSNEQAVASRAYHAWSNPDIAGSPPLVNPSKKDSNDQPKPNE